MNARNGILALLAVLALAGCVDTVPTEPGAVPYTSKDGPGSLGSGAEATTTTTSDTTGVVERGVTTLGNGA